MGDTAQEHEEEAWDPLRATPAVEEEPAEGTERNRWSGRREAQRVWCHRSNWKGLFRRGRWSIRPDVSKRSDERRTQESPSDFMAWDN